MRLMAELDPSDPLSSLAALQALQELAESAGPAAARVLCEQLAPRLQPLLADPSTAPGALPVAARLLGQAWACSSSHGSSSGGAAAANGNGVAAMDVDGGLDAATAELLRFMAGQLDDA
jgi:hypothetical protein